MSRGGASDWVVLKFGGTSVSSGANWANIAAIAQQRLTAGDRVLIVHSALSGVTDRLETLLSDAVAGDYVAALDALRARHEALIAQLGIESPDSLDRWWRELGEELQQIVAARGVDDRARARVMAMGELLATTIGEAYLQSRGVPARWLDARDWLRAETREAATQRASYLSATCDFRPNAALQQQLESLGRVLITQGFIASDAAGETVLLGRGGSDTSGAYFAALMHARQLEIWTDVPGMFSANPRATPTARQLLELTYDEAQEIATAGAKVLHPRCLLPVRQFDIPLFVYATQAPSMRGTRISAAPVSELAQVKAVCVKKGVTLVSMDSPGMWHQVGFLADAFQVFKRHGMSVDQVSTSETNVTVSLDPQANALDASALAGLQRDLAPLCRAELIGPCASVSLVGQNIRGILHRLGSALELLADRRIYLVSQAANDLNLTFVVDQDQGDRLVESLHELLVEPVRDDLVLGPTWAQLFTPDGTATKSPPAWWQARRARLLELMRDRDSAYVYDRDTLRERCRELKAMGSIARVSYAMKANPHPEVLRAVHEAGLALECVSRGEVERVLATLPDLDPRQVLYTPNFAPREEYAWALTLGVHVTLDSLHPIERWPELFRDRNIFVRLDPGSGRGHHQHVRTAGSQSKFGVAHDEIERFAAAVHRAGARVVGLHAHAGSGILGIDSWLDTANFMIATRGHFPHAGVFDLGGGLGIPTRLGGRRLDLTALDAALAKLRPVLADVALWLEPGRYVIAEAGVLLARVTQLKTKGDVSYVGVATGMNSLIRPALYGAHHDIVNLSREADGALRRFEVVGPICETGDVLGHDRYLPADTSEGDILLIATAGAYGASMASHYNLRDPAEELLI
ncbi:MAG: bifunctional aspartate kinase/diaminopimelate decarboxylase [Steroidobacteraceae bacterium]|jgi:diaminopimelate decarboxylase/aspartate kinase